MSRYIATSALRGARAIVAEADQMLKRALAEKGPETPVAFPNTFYALPVIYSLTGRKVEKLGDLVETMNQAKALAAPDARQTATGRPTWARRSTRARPRCWPKRPSRASALSMARSRSAFLAFTSPGGTSFTSPEVDKEAAANGHLNGPIDDIQLRSWGIQLVDGRMPGFAAIVGCAKSNEVAVKIVRELQRRNILIFLCGNVNGRSIIHQLQEEGVEMGYDTYIVPFGLDTISAIYPLGFAARSALTFGGLKPGQAREILLYNKARVFAFVLALGEVDDLKYATAAGAINYGFPVVADTIIPQILPTGVTHLRARHLDAVQRNPRQGRPGTRRAIGAKVHRGARRQSARGRSPDPGAVRLGVRRRSRPQARHARRVRRQEIRCFEYLKMADFDAVTGRQDHRRRPGL